MTELTLELEALGRELTAALGRTIDRRRRRRRLARAATAVVGIFCALTAVAFASGIGDDLHLDPTKWAILESGSVDGGKGAYVKARSKADGRRSTFMVEHDAALPRYEAFLLHERVVDAAGGGGETGPVCTPAQLTRAESIALSALAATFPQRAGIDRTKAAVDEAVARAFAGERCRGLEYAGERARFVYAGIEPASMLMPGAR